MTVIYNGNPTITTGLWWVSLFTKHINNIAYKTLLLAVNHCNEIIEIVADELAQGIDKLIKRLTQFCWLLKHIWSVKYCILSQGYNVSIALIQIYIVVYITLDRQGQL